MTVLVISSFIALIDVILMDCALHLSVSVSSLSPLCSRRSETGRVFL